MKKFIFKKIAHISALLAQKSQKSLNKKAYNQAFLYLDLANKLSGLVGSPPYLSPVTTTLRLELNFLTHNFQYILDNIEIPINSIEKTKLDWSEADRRYIKVYNYNFVLLIYILLDDGDKVLEWYHIINDITVEGVNPKMIGYFPAYTKERLKKLFESEPYYAQNYSEEILGNVFEISEHIWGI